MTFLACAFYGAFCRKWLGYSVTRAMGLGATLGLIGQAVILTMTVLSYALHLDTYFVNPRALNATEPLSFGTALVGRIGGLVVNCVMCAIAAAIGWVMGMALPPPTKVS
jgi:hypothetical protein